MLIHYGKFNDHQLTCLILTLQHPTAIKHGYVTMSKYFCIDYLGQSLCFIKGSLKATRFDFLWYHISNPAEIQ